MKKTLLIAASLLALASCRDIPSGAYFNRGDPENLIDSASEVISLTLANAGSLSDISSMIAQDPPARAELGCKPADKLCMDARKIFDRQGIPVQHAGEDGTVSLIYERITARDCTSRYVDNSSNVYNLHHPTFGCSVTANTVQQVSDKRQFTSPALMDFPDAEKAVQAHRGYLKPAEEKDKSTKPLTSTIGSGATR